MGAKRHHRYAYELLQTWDSSYQRRVLVKATHINKTVVTLMSTLHPKEAAFMRPVWAHNSFHVLGLALALALPMVALPNEAKRATDAMLDTAGIERAIGKAGEAKGDVYKVSMPRTDLHVAVDNVQVKPGFALGSWIAFKPTAHGAVAHGDLVLIEQEVPLVVQALEARGIRVTALHNHLIGESPRVMFLHFWGQGDAAELAQHLRETLSKTKTPLADAKKPGALSEPAGFDAEEIESVLGHKGTVKQGVLHISVPRTEPVLESGIELSPSMGTATAINIQDAETGKIAATGDFVMTADEVNRVASTLTKHGIQVTARHNHLLHAEPQVYFMHFWAHDAADQVARGLKAALDAMKRNP